MANPRSSRGARRGRRSGKRPARRALARALIGGLAALVALALAALGWLAIVYPKQRGPGRGRDVTVTVRAGMPLEELARELHAAGAVESPFLFAAYARLLGAGARCARARRCSPTT
ncbi:MAG: hypothetical protein M5U28_03945 [Sandaracinaceae bacterium]|nr:hypothetical protein [Sandaracinaceae bacterium]